MDKITNFPITVYGERQKFNDTITRGRCRVFYKGHNRNGTYITPEFAQKLIASAPYTPIKGIFDAEGGDYADHGERRDMGRIYGIVPADPNFAWEKHCDEDGVEREYACFDVLYYTALYPEAGAIASKGESMELYRGTLQGDWRFVEGRKAYVFTDGCFLGLQVLGDEVEPCFEGASFYTQEEMLLEILARYEKKTDLFSDPELGGKEMENENIEMTEEFIEEPVEAEVVEETVEAEPEAIEVEPETVEAEVETAEVETEAVEVEPEEPSVEISEETDTQKVESEDTNATLTIETDTASEEYERLRAEYDELNAKYTAACEELATLRQYYNSVEETYKLSIIEEYSDILEESVLDNYRERLAEYTREGLDRDLAYECKKNYPAMFSKKSDPKSEPQPQYVPKADVDTRGIKHILEKYER